MFQPGDDDQFAFTVSTVWRDERVSCPHGDILRAYDAAALPEGAMEFLDFHLNEAQCPYCIARLQDMRTTDAEAMHEKLEDVKDRLLRSTARALRKVSG